MSINKVILLGLVGKDPEVRYFDRESCVAHFSLATSEREGKLPDGTQLPERTEWHNIVAYQDTARFVEQWVRRGAMLYVEGKLRYRTYVDRGGVQRYVTEIVADRIRFFDDPRKNESSPRIPKGSEQ
ncbi:Helix-destabilizing protein [Porphyromonas crevioricanis]|uniref:Single-stranded DNA-binding protein n=1 Tax=Porphyromonas crevioricanis TaxID=393921 RepID=A0A2X4PM33_9PORP|nr:single-stranded DNA-binding protein [Porphyromonas crevioricanis]GAD08213.1 single-stranded DNA-binding protein [Porphyromonas crevioricanis JCM 13913]SQH73910.1 Helix-destabilizing protein [Porphyromonas crevioricanis]